MVVIFCIIGIVTMFSLYEFYSSRNWQQVTSSSRNEVVFEKRNKAYGAYAMRRDYNKQLVAILFFLVAGFGVSYGAFRFSKTNETEVVDDYNDGYILTPFDAPTEEKIEVPETPVEVQHVSQPTFTFVEPEITDDPLENSDPLEIPDGETIANDHTTDGDPGFPTDPDIGEIEINTTIEKIDNTIYGTLEIDEIAEFPGGVPERMRFLQTKTKYPEGPASDGIEGPCYLQFVVSKSGEISSVKVIRGVKDCPECDQEAIRVVKSMPIWKPGKRNGEPVNSIFNLKINFELGN